MKKYKYFFWWVTTSWTYSIITYNNVFFVALYSFIHIYNYLTLTLICRRGEGGRGPPAGGGAEHPVHGHGEPALRRAGRGEPTQANVVFD